MTATTPTFAVFPSHPGTQLGVFCGRHLGQAILDDASGPNAPDVWKVYVSDKPCTWCVSGAEDDIDVGIAERAANEHFGRDLRALGHTTVSLDGDGDGNVVEIPGDP